jgi:DNA-binding MarR family transcriptional regulator
VSLPTGPTDTDAPLGFVLGAAARKLAKFYAAALAGGPVTPSQLYFLRQLWLADGLPLSELRLRAQLDATSATWLTDQLEKAGLIERRRNDPDRRVVRVWLTPAGRALRDELAPRIADWEAALTTALERGHSAKDVATFRAVLNSLLVALPEGDDLWTQLSAAWDTALDALRRHVEASEHEGVDEP